MAESSPPENEADQGEFKTKSDAKPTIGFWTIAPVIISIAAFAFGLISFALSINTDVARLKRILPKDERSGEYLTVAVKDDVADTNGRVSQVAGDLGLALSNIGNYWGEREKRPTTGRDVFINTSKTLLCDQGYYSVGLVVNWGGTCDKVCNKDGGIINELSVICRKINTAIR